MEVHRCRWRRPVHLYCFGSALSCGCVVQFLNDTRVHTAQVNSPCCDERFGAWCLLSRFLLMFLCLFSSRHCTPLWHTVRHSTLSVASTPRLTGLISHFLRMVLTRSLCLFFCPPTDRSPSLITPYNSCLGSLLSSILMTWPSHPSYRLDMLFSILTELALRMNLAVCNHVSPSDTHDRPEASYMPHF